MVKKMRKALPPKIAVAATGANSTPTAVKGKAGDMPMTNPILKKKTGLAGWMNKKKMVSTSSVA